MCSGSARSGGRHTPTTSLSANSGYQINALYQHTPPTGPVQNFPNYFNTSNIPPVENTFYGTFGAGNFASAIQSAGGYVAGGVLGQTILPGVTAQGYVVSANGQANPANVATSPVQNSPTSGTQP